MVAGIKPIEIRRASPDDMVAAWTIAQEYFSAADVIARENREEFAARYFDDRSGFWLAYVDHNLAGCIALRPLPECGPGSAEIKRLYVRPSFRGHGLAKSLLQELESFAVSVGYRRLYLDTAANMHDAARLYERSGYQHCARYNENPQAAIFMTRQLQRGLERVP